MEKRKYRKIRELLPIIEAKIAAGQSHSEIEKELGLEGDRPIHNLLKRERRKAARGIPKQRVRKPAKTLQEYYVAPSNGYLPRFVDMVEYFMRIGRFETDAECLMGT